MTIQIQNITKQYSKQKALDGINLSINKGEIVALLGPNGAGKSTLMKIITGYLPQTKGKVIINQQDAAATNFLNLRKKIGYLPENNPLYTDMYVTEYLHFVAKIYQLKKPRQAVRNIIDLTGLQNEQHKKIQALSKGYRQRVGLAQALIHNPEILILDEPTTGLDPNQIIEIRNLIKQIAHNKTILLSTHILQEAQVLCNRIVIINKANIVADSPTTNLATLAKEQQQVIVELDSPVPLQQLQRIETIAEVKQTAPNTYTFTAQQGEDCRSHIFNFAVEKKYTLLTLKEEQRSLENIFKELTLS